MQEIWKDIEGYEGHYQVSTLGRIKSLKYDKERILKPSQCTKVREGYHIVALSNRTMKGMVVHRLVAKAFISNPENKRTVNHKNGIKTDNRVENLEWMTDSENHKHSYRELGREPNWTGKLGKYHNASKPIIQYTIDGEYIAEYEGMSDASRKTGISVSSLSQACNGKFKTSWGFTWKFK